MQYKQLISAVAVFASTAVATLALEHGEYADHNGLVIRYRQLAPGIFTGVPADEWDDSVHQRSDEELDFNELYARSLNIETNDSLSEFEERNLDSICQAATTCAKVVGTSAVAIGKVAWQGWLNAAEAASRRAHQHGLIDFLKTPFFANAGGVAIAGVISAHINGQANPKPAECSTSKSEADVVGAAIAAAVASNPKANEISVNINGPSGTWAITIAATSANQTPHATCH
ncbi:hypothetical protein K449DRAFT_403015 [Hypoxylon sp. EC38]|nr:hypothetical protein K449DRAFT_403015 [Hypoxylon sp. EC38]